MATSTDYNTKLTEQTFSGEYRRAQGARVLYDTQQKVMGSVSKDAIYDLNGQEVAPVQSRETAENEKGEKTRVAVYATETRTFRVVDDKLYAVDGSGEQKRLGTVAYTKRNLVHIIMLSVLAALLTATIVIISLLGIPYSESVRPIIDIRDNNGNWEAQGTIAVFGDSVRPGSEGAYDFELYNPHSVEMLYAFSIEPQYEGEETVAFPLQFRLRMNNVLMQSEEWRSADELVFTDMAILAETAQAFTLEWRWPFEAGADENDTLIGKDGGKISMVLHLTAQAR